MCDFYHQKSRRNIFLSPRDLFFVALSLQISIESFVDNYCDVFIDECSKLPVIELKKEEDGTCIFSDCETCEHKPESCMVYPYKRIFAFNYFADNIRYLFKDEEFDFNDCDFPGEETDIEKTDNSFFSEWCEFVNEFGRNIRTAVNTLPESIIRNVWTCFFAEIYLNYDVNQPFNEQFNTNKKRMLFLLDYLLKKVC